MKTILKTSVAAAALVAFAAPTMAQSNFETGQPKVKLKLYGQVNKAMMFGDDGDNSRTFVVDSAASSTRVGFTATAPVNADFSFGAQIEAEWMSNQSSAVAIQNGTTLLYTNAGGPLDNNTGQTTFTERVMEVTMNHKRFGKVSLGQGGESSDGIAEYNQSGATLVSGAVASASYMVNTALFNTTGNAHLTRTLGNVYGYFDGARDDRVRYDTPAFMGFSVGGSFTSGGRTAVAARYDNKIGAFKIQGGVAYTNQNSLSTVIDDEVAGSAAVLHDSGVNASFSMGNRNFKNEVGTTVSVDDATFVGGSVGYIAKIFGVGPTAFAVDMYKSENINRVNNATTTNEWDATTWGLGVQQTFSDIGTDVYLGYRNFDVGSPTGTSVDDVNVVVAGVRVTF